MTMTSTDKTYLMIGGTQLPAFVGVAALALISKESISAKSAKYLLTFAALSVIGGYFSSKMIKRAETV